MMYFHNSKKNNGLKRRNNSLDSKTDPKCIGINKKTTQHDQPSDD